MAVLYGTSTCMHCVVIPWKKFCEAILWVGIYLKLTFIYRIFEKIVGMFVVGRLEKSPVDVWMIYLNTYSFLVIVLYWLILLKIWCYLSQVQYRHQTVRESFVFAWINATNSWKNVGTIIHNNPQVATPTRNTRWR